MQLLLSVVSGLTGAALVQASRDNPAKTRPSTANRKRGLRRIPETVTADEMFAYVEGFAVQGVALNLQMPLDIITSLHSTFVRLDRSQKGKILLVDYYSLARDATWDWLAGHLQVQPRKLGLPRCLSAGCSLRKS